MRTQLLRSRRLRWRHAGSLGAALIVMGGAAYWGFWSPSRQAEAGAFTDAGTLARLDRLEAEAYRLSQHLGIEPMPGVILAQSGSMPDGYAAQVEVRLSQLEAQMRALTGRIEQAQYDARQLADQLERSMQDVEFRLDMLEGGTSGGAAGPLGPIAGNSPPAAAEPAAPSGIGPTYDRLSELTTGAEPSGGTLGTLTVPGGDGAGGTSVASLPGDAQGQYDAAFQMLQRGDYSGAEAALQRFLSAYPSHELASDAQFFLGETYYIRAQYNNAALAFAQSYEDYPSGSRAVDSLLKLGMSLAALGQRVDACITFAQLRTEFPGAPARVINQADQESDRLECQ